MKKSDREIMEILEAYDLTGCAHSAAQLAGCDEKTVTRYVAVRDAGGDPGVAGDARAHPTGRHGRGVAGVGGRRAVGHRRYRPAQARLPRHEARGVVVYRFVVPLVAEVILAVGAVAMIAGGQAGVFAPAAFVVLMFVVGTENAWDLLLGTGLGPQDHHP